MKHIHAEIIKEWADGAQIQFREEGEEDWIDIDRPGWCRTTEYRVKPETVTTYIERKIPIHLENKAHDLIDGLLKSEGYNLRLI